MVEIVGVVRISAVALSFGLGAAACQAESRAELEDDVAVLWAAEVGGDRACVTEALRDLNRHELSVFARSLRGEALEGEELTRALVDAVTGLELCAELSNESGAVGG